MDCLYALKIFRFGLQLSFTHFFDPLSRLVLRVQNIPLLSKIKNRKQDSLWLDSFLLKTWSCSSFLSTNFKLSDILILYNNVIRGFKDGNRGVYSFSRNLFRFVLSSRMKLLRSFILISLTKWYYRCFPSFVISLLHSLSSLIQTVEHVMESDESCTIPVYTLGASFSRI